MNFLPAFPTQQKTCAHQTAHFYSVMMMKLKIEFIQCHQFSFGLFTWPGIKFSKVHSLVKRTALKGQILSKITGRSYDMTHISGGSEVWTPKSEPKLNLRKCSVIVLWVFLEGFGHPFWTWPSLVSKDKNSEKFRENPNQVKSWIISLKFLSPFVA